MADTITLPSNKTELLAFIQAQWNAFVQASDAFPDDIWLGPANDAGWTIRDHVGHVAVWTRAEIPLLTSGTPIPQTAGMPQELWDQHDGDAINAWIREKLQSKSPEQVRAVRDELFPRLIAAVSAFSDDDLRQPARVSGLENSDRPLLTVMSENYGLHFDDHRNQIEELGKQGASA